MSAGVQDFVTINLDTLAEAFDANDSVTIAALQAKRILNLSGREARLPLKVMRVFTPYPSWNSLCFQFLYNALLNLGQGWALMNVRHLCLPSCVDALADTTIHL